MNTESFLRKRKFLAIAVRIRTSIVNAVSWFLKMAFTKRTLLFVTNQKIRSITLGPIAQLCVFLFIAWVANLFYQSLQFNKILNEKSSEISRLEDVNSYFESEFSNINEKLKKVNEYLVTTTGHTTFASDKKKEFETPQTLDQEKFSKSDKHTLRELKHSVEKLENIQEVAHARIQKIEKMIALTGLSLKQGAAFRTDTVSSSNKIKNSAEIDNADYAANSAQGGPFIPAKTNKNKGKGSAGINDFIISQKLQTKRFQSDMDRLIVLEKLTKLLPLSRPMKNYFISSGFGSRVDPITHGFATHHGLDFVGPNREKIISPSEGRVVLAGQFSGYGNAIVIDHGYGITTRYGHLSKVKVQKGQIVKKGDIIALQGNTGRSTGQHLHYEVRYRNIPLNPKKFIQAGDYLFNDSSNSNYANS